LKSKETSCQPGHISFINRIVSQNIWHFEIIGPLFYLVFGFIALTTITYAFSFFINDEIDWRILMFLNPDSPILLLDDLMILITDFSMFGFGLFFLVWVISYQTSKATQKTKENVERFLKIIGIIFLLLSSSAYFWAGYEHRIIFFPLALLFFGVFWFIGNRVNQYEKEKLEQINRLFWITLLATLLTELSAEMIIKNMVARPRPLSDAYLAYNQGIRMVADEIVRGGYSYVAGHSSVFFAMITPLMLFVSRKWVKAGLFIWAMVHAFTRVYLAAHFPFCSLMGAALGFSMATLVVKTFEAPVLHRDHESRFI
jgi:undecaprenyl-diphosphatase